MKYCADCILKQFPPCDKGVPCCKCDELQCNSRQPCQWKDERLSNAGMFACRSESCPSRDRCARWAIGKADPYRVAMLGKPGKHAQKCKHFIKIEP